MAIAKMRTMRRAMRMCLVLWLRQSQQKAKRRTRAIRAITPHETNRYIDSLFISL